MSRFSIPIDHAALPITQSHQHDEMEKAMAAVFHQLLSSMHTSIDDHHHYGTPYLGSRQVVERFTTLNGLAVLRRPDESADAGLLEFAKDEIDSVFWRVDTPSSLFLFGGYYAGAIQSGSARMDEMLNNNYSPISGHVFENITGEYTEGSPLKEFGFVLKDGTRLSRSFG